MSKEQKKYVCIKPLTLPHLYTEPTVITIMPSWGEFILLSKNKQKGTVRLKHNTSIATMSNETFEEHFIEVQE